MSVCWRGCTGRLKLTSASLTVGSGEFPYSLSAAMTWRAFRLPTDDADGLLGPEFGDEPTLLLRTVGEPIGLFDGQPAHRRRPATLSCVGAVVAEVL